MFFNSEAGEFLRAVPFSFFMLGTCGVNADDCSDCECWLTDGVGEGELEFALRLCEGLLLRLLSGALSDLLFD